MAVVPGIDGSMLLTAMAITQAKLAAQQRLKLWRRTPERLGKEPQRKPLQHDYGLDLEQPPPMRTNSRAYWPVLRQVTPTWAQRPSPITG